jgi:hypothetical protein
MRHTSPVTRCPQVFGSDAVDAGDVAAALRDVGVVVDSGCDRGLASAWLRIFDSLTFALKGC